MTKVSVIMPVYNTESYISKCMESVLNQSLKDIEIICVDDGSTDSSGQILDNYAKEDDRVKVVHQKNQGQGIARNNAIQLAQGEYTVFADPDDWLEDGALEKIYNFMTLKKADVIHFNYIGYDEETKNLKYNDLKYDFKKAFNYDLSENGFYICKNLGKRCLSDVGLVIWNKAYSTKYIKENNIHFAPNKHAEDHLFALMSLLNTEKVYFLDEYLYVYRTISGSAVNKLSDENFCIFDNVKLLKDFLTEKKLYDELEESYKLYAIDVLAWHFNSVCTESREEYNLKVKELLNKDEYSFFLRKINGKSFLENIFSLKRKRINGISTKVLTIFGLELYIRKNRNG